ncbi:hypothetical protein AA14337_2937 [Acetobacter malorum DSM 14337]|uniref:Uncharacterized protein n=1 Tax=Acetobacter malorum DSM 14337 TaxID=1307910 RepID=A0ABQ0PYP1_9PROT|nr:hypothetical protein AA14337_2937 [Acetobacter malorum DSM 14337]
MKGDLFLNDCPALEALPSDLIVEGHLSLTGCDGIMIPEEVIERMGDRITLPQSYEVIPAQDREPSSDDSPAP